MASQDQNRPSMPHWDSVPMPFRERGDGNTGSTGSTGTADHATPHATPHAAPHAAPHSVDSPFGFPPFGPWFQPHLYGQHPPPPPPRGWDQWRRHDFDGHHGHGQHHDSGGKKAEADLYVDEKGKEKASTRARDEAVPDPAEMTPDEDDGSAPPADGPACASADGRRRRGHGRCRGGMHRGGWSHRGRHAGPPFDFPTLMRGAMDSPFFRCLQDQAQRFASGVNFDAADGSSSFTPSIDVFNTKDAYVLHVALPGARKEDIGLTWDSDNGTLNVAGVVHRPGDEHFIQTLSVAERRVGMFDRHIDLPPAGAGEKEEIDASGITAKMEDGILVVVVPKAEKEWTQVHKVEIA
ncbi:hypothetical protein RJ55_02323 [Drechmeria coniospora]|nr:hypothetical protein RJ55_02323 [Drechmeria coniospora]